MEDTNSSANHGAGTGTARRPGESKPGLPGYARVGRQSLMQAGLDGLVVRLIDIVRDAKEIAVVPCKAIGLADRVRIMLCSESHRQFEVFPDRPFVLRIESQSIHRDWLGWSGIESLCENATDAIEKVA